jgi:hypothetical protein
MTKETVIKLFEKHVCSPFGLHHLKLQKHQLIRFKISK